MPQFNFTGLRRSWIVGIFALLFPITQVWASGCFGDHGPGILVKTIHSSYIEISDSNCNEDPTQEIASFELTLAGFTAANAVTIWPLSGDPNRHTDDPMTTFPVSDQNNRRGNEGPYQLQTFSLKDLGSYAYALSGFSDDGTNTSPLAEDTMNFPIFNDAPTANLTLSSPLHVGHTVAITSNAVDPDGGALPNFVWTVTKRPAGTTDTFPNASSNNASIALTDKHDIGLWQVQMVVADNEGELKTFTKDFEVTNQPPQLSISGALNINAMQDIALTAGPAQDLDGEDVTFSWDLVSSTPSASMAPQSHFSTDASIRIPTGPKDIGVWTFKCTATDEHQATDAKTVSVTVNAVAPQLHIEGATQIKVGDVLNLNDTILNDGYGDPMVSFQWDLVQVPVSANVPLQNGYGSTPQIQFPTTLASAGTWKFKLTVTDQAHQTAEQDISVLVDAPPTADIAAPATAQNGANPIDLDGSASADPDSPSMPPDYGHLHSGPVDISPGIVTYEWNVLDVPSDQYGTVFPGPVADVLGIDGSATTLHIPGGTLQTGDWTFGLTVIDGEGNQATATKSVTVIPPNTLPLAIAGPPQAFLVNAAGMALGDIGADGRASFDPDNLLTDSYGPGLGITAYAWRVLTSPPGCVPPAFTHATEPIGLLYPTGSTVSPLCQGIHTVGLTVTDDDTPTARTGTDSTTLLIGNCAGDLCIDNPTQAQPQFVKFAEDTDVVVTYHLNSLYYDLPQFLAGLRLEMSVYHELDLVTPTFSGSWDLDMLPSNRGLPLALHWSGYDNAGRRPLSGKYSVTLRLVDGSGHDSGISTTQVENIWIQTLDVNVSSESTKYINRDELLTIDDLIEMDYKVTGAVSADAGYDQLHLRVLDHATAAVIHEEDLPGPYDGQAFWTGDIGGGVIISTGVYDVQLEILDKGRSLSKSAFWPLTVYRMGVTQSSYTLTYDFPGLYVPVDNDQDSRHILSLHFSMDPPISGTLVVNSTGPVGLLQLWDGPARTYPLALPANFNMTSSTLTFAFEARAPGQTRMDLQFIPEDALALPTTSFAMTAVQARVVNNDNNNFIVEAADSRALFVRPLLWDSAFRLIADGAGQIGTLFNEQDQTHIGVFADPHNFIGRDSRRFYFEITDPSAVVNPAVIEELNIADFDWFTLKSTAPATVIDDLPPLSPHLTLTETGPGTGVFVSQAVGLVTDLVDLNQPTNTGVRAHPGRAALYNQDNHRTRLTTTTNGLLDWRYRPLGGHQELEWQLPVFQREPDERRKMTVHIFTFQDIYTRAIAPPTQAMIDASTQTIHERYAAIGIDVVFIYNPATDLITLPKGSTVNLYDVDESGGAYPAETPSDDQTVLINLMRGVDPAGPGNADTLYLLFVSRLTRFRGESFPDGWTDPGSIASNVVFVSVRQTNGPTDYSAPHELGHMLTSANLTMAQASGKAGGWADGGHYGGPQDVNNLMHDGTIVSVPRAVTDTKRYWDDVRVHLVAQITRIMLSRFVKRL